MKIIIITRPDDASPKVLAESLKKMFDDMDVEAEILFNVSFLSRLLPVFGKNKRSGRIHFRVKEKLFNFFRDNNIIKKLKRSDAIVLSECTPNGFWRNYHGIEELKSKVKNIPIIYHEVYYLGNAPSQIDKLATENNPTIDRYDWHLAVSEVTEIRTIPKPPWSCVGLNLENTGLKPIPKQRFFAIVDFEQKGYEEQRNIQKEALKLAGIEVISFEKKMPINKIRNFYQNASIYFITSPEAFGLPIAECLASGTAVFTPSSSWPMSWRLDENPKMWEKGQLPECFVVYNDKDDLVEKLISFKNNFDYKKTPLELNRIFKTNYPHFYYGNTKAVIDLTDRIKHKQFSLI